MGIQSFGLNQRMDSRLIRDIVVIASDRELSSLVDLDGDLSAMTRLPLDTTQALPIDRLRDVRAVFVEVAPDTPASLTRLAVLRRELPDVPVVAAVRHAELDLVRHLVRQGVSDVISLPFSAPELAGCVAELLNSPAPDKRQAVALAPLICVIRGSGGAGATTVLTHLAAALGERLGGSGKVCMVDLDLQSGDAASYLGLDPASSVLDLLDAGDRLDANVVRTTAIDTGEQFSLIAAPTEIAPVEKIEADRLLHLLSVLRREYEVVLVDLPSAWLSWTVSAIATASQVVVVTEQKVTSLRNARRTLDLLGTLEIDSSRVSIVVNRMERRMFQTIGTKDVEEALDRRVIGTIAADDATLAAAQTQGHLASRTSKRFSRDIRVVADCLLDGGTS